jgi:membrane fusion protein, heavy metal efflux system
MADMLPILLLGVGLLGGCAQVSPEREGPAAAPSTAVDPEMCAEHGVLQAVCTQCNPSLAAVFQAKGDWCEEHQFPESFCPICSPERGGRPVQTELSADGSPPDGTKVRLAKRETAARAGISTVGVVEEGWVGGTEAVVRLDWDATRVALVSARSPGVVVAIRADVGTPVQPGGALAQLRSAHVGGDRSRVTAARQGLGVARAELERKRALLVAGVTSQREVLVAERAAASAVAVLGALESELGLVGGGSGDSYTVTSPIAGVVTARHAAVGLSVGPNEPLFQVVDPSRMWAELDVAEADLYRVAPGQDVEITLDALPDQGFAGTIAYIAPSVDPSTRTARARVELDNAEGVLRAHMYGSARIVTDAAESAVTVPSASVQRAGDVHLVFLRVEADTYIARRVRVLARKGDQVRISGAVHSGDQVVTTGSFLLKTETLKDSIGAGCCADE